MAKEESGTIVNEEPLDFVREIVRKDVGNGKNNGRVHTRFPPEPNGHLHIGHAKSICLNFGIADEFGGKCNLRFDDTNPENENEEYVESIKDDVRWLGFDWEERLFYASDYFDQFYEWAQYLIKEGKAYVCSLTEDEIRAYRGSVGHPGRPSPDRDRPPEESLDLLERMKQGEFTEGEYTLRAKIDMSHSNMKMRDPLIYRIRKQPHHRTGKDWNIYPMYDFAHGQSDAIEGITHSICTLEFQANRPLYGWFIDNLPVPHHPHQYEFARLNLSYTVMSKRKLGQLVEQDYVSGWDDPRMPTISGLRRRGYTSESIREFCDRTGVAKRETITELSLLEWSVRNDLNRRAPRVMGVLRPLKVVIENYPEGKTEQLEAANNPEDPNMSTRELPFSRELYIEQDDFREDAPKKWFRFAPGKEVRLKHAYLVTCKEVIKNDKGEVVELRCTYDPETRGGEAPDGRKVRGALHWVSARHAVDAEVRLYDRLFSVRDPLGEDGDFTDYINPKSLDILDSCKLEPSLAQATISTGYQFYRKGYFCLDSRDSASAKLVFNRTVPLRNSWAKIEKKQQKKA